jgi:hypothetical protein
VERVDRGIRPNAAPIARHMVPWRRSTGMFVRKKASPSGGERFNSTSSQ